MTVFDEVVLDLNQRIRHAMSDAARGAPTRLEAERLGFAGFFRFTAEHPALYRVIRQAEFVSPRVLRNHYETITGHYAPFLEEAMSTGEVSSGDPWCSPGPSRPSERSSDCAGSSGTKRERCRPRSSKR